jgi:ParB family chromosome partitioning protein
VTAAKVQPISRPLPAGASVRSLPLSALHAAPWNARQTFDEQAQQELVASIRQHGLLVALIVRPIEIADGEVFEIVAGHRRFLAAGELKLDEVACDVRSLTDEQAREVGLVDNLQRADLSALEEAEAYQQMFQLAGSAGEKITPAGVAAKVGKPEGHVRLRLRLLSAELAVREALRADRITLGHAIELARLGATMQKELLDWLQFESWGERKSKREVVPSLPELKRHIREDVMLDLAKAPFDTKDTALVPAAGACVDCEKRTGNNRLLFADVKQGDICTDPPCYSSKLTRSIDIAIEQLTAKGEKAVRISEHYQRQKSTPKEALVSQQYHDLQYAGRRDEKCDALAVGIYVGGRDRGKRIRICLDAKCKVHAGGYRGAGASASPEDVARRAKARAEKECRVRIFKAALEATAKAKAVSDAQVRELVAYAVDRGDNNGVVALLGLLEWPKAFAQFAGRKQLLAKLATVTAGRAAAIGLLASVANALAVNEYNISKPESLEEVARGFGVDVAKIRKEVAAELAKKKAKKAPAEKAAKKGGLSAAARAKIAAAQKARWVKARWVKAKKAGRK